MQGLNKIITLLNESIVRSITGTYHIEGVCRVASKGKERVVLNSKGNTVLFDDKFNHYVYTLSSSTSYTQLKSPGKSKRYMAVSTAEVICFSSDKNFQKYIESRISSQKRITLKEVNTNSFDIFKREVNQDKYDPARHVFSARIEVSYQTDTCYECSEQICNPRA